MQIMHKCEQCGFTTMHHVSVPANVRSERDRIIEVLSDRNYLFGSLSKKDVEHLLIGIISEDDNNKIKV